MRSVNSEPSRQNSRRAFQTAALAAILAGAAGSVGLTLWAGRRNKSRLLPLLFTIWVLSPFAALAYANLTSRRRLASTQVALHSLTLAIALTTLALYAYIALGPPRSRTAPVFVIVPPASLLLMAVVFSLAPLVSRRASR